MISCLLVAALWNWTAVAETLTPFLQISFCGECVKTGIEEKLHGAFWMVVEERLPGGVGEGGSEEVGKMSLLDQSLDVFM